MSTAATLSKQDANVFETEPLSYLEKELEYYDDDDDMNIDHKEILRNCKQWVDEHGGDDEFSRSQPRANSNVNLYSHEISADETLNAPVKSKGSYTSYSSLISGIQRDESCDRIKTLSEGERSNDDNDNDRNSPTCDLCISALHGNSFPSIECRNQYSMDKVKGAMASICGRDDAYLDIDVNDMVSNATIVRVIVKSDNMDLDTGQENWALPLSLIIDREKEMKKHADSLGLLWNGSVIINEVQKYFYKVRTTRSQMKFTGKESRKETWYCLSHEISIILDLDEELAKIAPLDVLQWNPKLFDTIHRFYHTGIIHIVEDCPCQDVFLLLKCLGVLYNKNQLKFENFATYLRYNTWRTYREYRENVASWVKQEIEAEKTKRNGQRIAFVTSPSKDGTVYKIGNLECRVLEMEMEGPSVDPPYAVVHNFFNEEYIDKDPTSREYDRQIRSNFASFLQSYLPLTSISFAPRQVMIWKKEPPIRVASVLPVLLIERRINLPRRYFQRNGDLINALLSGSEFFPFGTLNCNACNMNLSEVDYGTYSTMATTTTTGSSSSNIFTGSSEEDYTTTMTSTFTGSSLTEQASNWIGDSISSSYSDSDIASPTSKVNTNNYLKMDDINAKWLVSIFVGNQ